MKTVHVRIYGIVQGVFFRKHTQLKANELGINGWVRNTADGSVELEAEAVPEILDSFLRWCQQGPEKAVVNKVEVAETSFKNFTSFEIRR
jgi:acylphosphatase